MELSAVHGYVHNLTLKVVAQQSSMASFTTEVEEAVSVEVQRVLEDAATDDVVPSHCISGSSTTCNSSSSCTELPAGSVRKSAPIVPPIPLAAVNAARDDLPVFEEYIDDDGLDDGEDLVAFEDSSFEAIENSEAIQNIENLPEEQPADDTSPFVGRVTRTVSDGMAYMGDKIIALNDSLDNQAEAAMQKVEGFVQESKPTMLKVEDLIKDKCVVMDSTCEKYVQQLDSLIKPRATIVAEKCNSACRDLDSKTAKYTQPASTAFELMTTKSLRCMNDGAVKAKATAKAAADAVRGKTADISAAEGMWRPKGVMKGLSNARDKMHAAVIGKPSQTSPISQGGA